MRRVLAGLATVGFLIGTSTGCATAQKVGNAVTAKGTSVKEESLNAGKTIAAALLNLAFNVIDKPGAKTPQAEVVEAGGQ